MKDIKNLLSNYELLQGVAASVNDPNKSSRIKVTFPTDENTDNTKLESLPWVYPFTTTGTYQGFSKLNQGTKVWVLRNINDMYELWYIPMFELNPNTKDTLSNDDESDVLISRSRGGDNAQLHYTNSGGMTMAVGGSSVNVSSDKSVNVTSEGGAHVKVNGTDVLINTDETTNHAAIAENVETALQQIKKCFDIIVSKIPEINELAPLEPDFTTAVSELESLVKEGAIASKSVYIDTGGTVEQQQTEAEEKTKNDEEDKKKTEEEIKQKQDKLKYLEEETKRAFNNGDRTKGVEMGTEANVLRDEIQQLQDPNYKGKPTGWNWNKNQYYNYGGNTYNDVADASIAQKYGEQYLYVPTEEDNAALQRNAENKKAAQAFFSPLHQN